MKKQDIYIIIISVIAAFVLSLFIKHSINSPEAFFSIEKSINYDLSDLYASVGTRSLKKDYCKDIVIISTDNSNRQKIGALIDTLNHMGAKVIGIDILFQTAQNEDYCLLSSIASADNIVLPVGLRLKENSSYFQIQDTCYFQNQLGHKTSGAINLNSDSIRSTIRNFKCSFRIDDSTSIDAFATAIIKRYSNDFNNTNKLYDDKERRINFHETDNFEVLSWEAILSSNPEQKSTYESLVKNRIVLLGNTNTIADMHTTPISVNMPGVYIHAYIIATILSNRAIANASSIVNYLVATLITLIFCSFVFYTRKRIKYIGKLLIRIIQFILMILFFYIGSILYLKHMVFVDFSLTLLMIGFSIFMLDLVSGVYWFYLLILNRKRINYE